MHYKMLSIDPGLSTTGWALFEVNEIMEEGKYIESGIILRPRKKCDWMFRLEWVVANICAMVELAGITKVVIERPQVFMSGKGQAAGNAGSILKLTGLVYTIYGSLGLVGISGGKVVKAGVDVMLVGVSKWKGQTPKRITQRRIMKHWRVLCEDHNEADAVGIGDWYIRKHLEYLPI